MERIQHRLFEAGLIVFDGQHVITAEIDDFLGDFALRKHRVARYHDAFHRNEAEQFQSGLVLIGFGIHRNLRQGRAQFLGVNGQQVDAGNFAAL